MFIVSPCVSRRLAGSGGTDKSVCDPVTALQLNQCHERGNCCRHSYGVGLLLHADQQHRLRRELEGQDVCLLTITVNTMGGHMETRIELEPAAAGLYVLGRKWQLGRSML